ncbi:extracellular protein containing 35aa signal peptide [Grimontia sp. AD028]|uniref:GlcG/HbpS family heme-binding protein n=1 Tax=Grimontia sp. AD028 TaxID=1581149 RepID=UPI00061A9E5D|nr:extracellular protein containing 35aa signal peptide [Grimontia sp. AD028]
MKLSMKHLALVIGATCITSFGVMAKDISIQKSELSSSVAFNLAVEAMNKCKKDGYAVTATVVDPTGRVLAQVRDNNAGTHTLESSRQKAFTSVSMKRPTVDLMKTINDKPILQPLQYMDENLLFLAGGIPLKEKDMIVGGIGVGGAPGGHLDVACAEAAIKKHLK